MRQPSRRFALVAGLALTVVWSVGCSYNTFTSQDVAIDAQWAQVENQLQRRSDLIPNLVETVKGYAAHEKEVFQAVSDARTKLAGAKTSLPWMRKGLRSATWSLSATATA